MPLTELPVTNIVHIIVQNKISLSNAMICRIKQKSFQFFLKSLMSVISLMSTVDAATENARSDETSVTSLDAEQPDNIHSRDSNYQY